MFFSRIRTFSQIINSRFLCSCNNFVNTVKFNFIKNEHIEFFTEIVGSNNLKTKDLDSYNYDWLKIHKGKSELALFPSNVQQLSNILKYCNENKLFVVISGGNTSLVAGACPANDEIIISTSKLNKILSFDDVSGILICEAGCILQNLEEYVNKKNYIMPYDLGAKGSCQIGGNLATNAGGLRLIRYGNLHGSVLGLEVVLMNGQIINMMSSMRKDNTGYDLKHLFIGSEGTLGVISKVSILCSLKSANKLVSILAVEEFNKLLSVFKLTRQSLNEYLSAFEMFDIEAMNIVEKNLKLIKPFDSRFYCLIEMSGTSKNNMENQFINLIENLFEKKIIYNGTYSTDLTTMNKLWSIRERIAEALLMQGYCFKYDLSIPLENYYELVEIMRKRLSKNKNVLSITGYGHIGDFNLHLTVITKNYNECIKNQIEPFIYEWVSSKNGSISAEHGLGLKKNNHIHYSKSKETIDLIKKIKKIIDPNLLLNPKKLIIF